LIAQHHHIAGFLSVAVSLIEVKIFKAFASITVFGGGGNLIAAAIVCQ